jgi:hypothetical protein
MRGGPDVVSALGEAGSVLAQPARNSESARPAAIRSFI